MTELDTDVVMIGGGPVGLSASLLLADYGIRSVVLERNPTTTNHPKASAFNTRTMEILRQLGIAEDVYTNAGGVGGMSFYTSLTGYKLGEISMANSPEYVSNLLASTPAPLTVSSQILLEATLKQHAEANDLIDLRFNCKKNRLDQDDSKVVVMAVDQANDDVLSITAAYAIACDGAGSPTRKELQRELIGPPAFGHQINVYIEADIESLLAEKTHQALYWIANPDAAGVFIGLGGDWNKWCFNFSYFPEKDDSPGDFTDERCVEKVYSALGTDQLDVKILSVGAWTLCGQIIDQMRDGRVFFGGDAAHLNIPTGGFGFNTGMQEIHNLAWKIAYVLRGEAPQRLLDTYHTERRPIAEYNVERSRENAYNIRRTGAGLGVEVIDADEIELDTERGQRQRQSRSDAIADQASHFMFLGQEIGFGYWDSCLITPDGSPHYVEAFDVEDPVYTYIANARPGARAPHCWLQDRNSQQVSTIDLFRGGFTLLTTPDIDAGDLPRDITVYRIGEPDSDADLTDLQNQWRQAYGIETSGCVLVRPDGHVACRITGDFNTDAINQARDRSLAKHH